MSSKFKITSFVIFFVNDTFELVQSTYPVATELNCIMLQTTFPDVNIITRSLTNLNTS